MVKKEWESIEIRYSNGDYRMIYKHEVEAIEKMIPVLQAFEEAKRLYERLGTLLGK